MGRQNPILGSEWVICEKKRNTAIGLDERVSEPGSVKICWVVRIGAAKRKLQVAKGGEGRHLATGSVKGT